MRIAVVGATGIVGTKLLKMLGSDRWRGYEVIALASDHGGADRKVRCGDLFLPVRTLREKAPEVDYAVFAVPDATSKVIVPGWIEQNVRVIDKSAHFRLHPDVPLVVPEVNGDEIRPATMLVATPNCSTTQLAVAVGPLRDAFGLEAVRMSSYQSVSGAGAAGVAAYREEISGKIATKSPFQTKIAGNVIPAIGSVDEFGNFTEETKVINELPKILGMPGLKVSVTAVRVPVEVGHGEAVEVTLERETTRQEILEVLHGAKGIMLYPEIDGIPSPDDAAGRDDVLVGRVRMHPTDRKTVLLWVVADNLRKGAATNALQILELWMNGGLR